MKRQMVTENLCDKIDTLLNTGLSVAEIKNILDISPQTIYRVQNGIHPKCKAQREKEKPNTILPCETQEQPFEDRLICTLMEIKDELVTIRKMLE